jgi:maltose O-acetyltransferase
MCSEKDKMLSGDLYHSNDPQLIADRCRAREIWQRFNNITAADVSRKSATLRELLGAHTDANIEAPFYCDYGFNIELGPNAYFNVNCVVLDVMSVIVGSNALFGPSVHIYTAIHPMSAADRRLGLEYGKPVHIGDDVWVGGSAIICPGVSIGSCSVIGAGSVVTRNIPEGVFAAGNPCRVIRTIKE